MADVADQCVLLSGAIAIGGGQHCTLRNRIEAIATAALGIGAAVIITVLVIGWVWLTERYNDLQTAVENVGRQAWNLLGANRAKPIIKRSPTKRTRRTMSLVPSRRLMRLPSVSVLTHPRTRNNSLARTYSRRDRPLGPPISLETARLSTRVEARIPGPLPDLDPVLIQASDPSRVSGQVEGK